MENNWEIFVDGASRGNPGQSGAGIYIKQKDIDFLKEGFFLEKKTNNQAEYLALALALFLLKKEISKSTTQTNHILNITSDSELLIKQMKGEYQVKNPILLQIKSLIDSMLQDFRYTFRHTLREKNKIADKLANQGIQSKKKMPQAFINLMAKNNITI